LGCRVVEMKGTSPSERKTDDGDSLPMNPRKTSNAEHRTLNVQCA